MRKNLTYSFGSMFTKGSQDKREFIRFVSEMAQSTPKSKYASKIGGFAGCFDFYQLQKEKEVEEFIIKLREKYGVERARYILGGIILYQMRQEKEERDRRMKT